jgi:hypothetical protein
LKFRTFGQTPTLNSSVIHHLSDFSKRKLDARRLNRDALQFGLTATVPDEHAYRCPQNPNAAAGIHKLDRSQNSRAK